MTANLYDQIFFKSLPKITGGRMLQLAHNLPVIDLIVDSRKASPVQGSVFIAIKGIRHDGHRYLDELHRLGCRQFIVEMPVNHTSFPDSNFLLVNSAIHALQKIVAAHRGLFSLPVIGITGSNGKTIVKEWLHQLLSPDWSIVKNPGSYNSQLGVPLSVWQIDQQHNLGIFEAGISKPGEMKALAEVIKPTIGIFTNLLAAHNEGFESPLQKAKEKALLMADCSTVIYCKDHVLVAEVLSNMKSQSGQASLAQKHFTWGFNSGADVAISKINTHEFRISFQGVVLQIRKEFSDSASWENLFHCVAVMLHLGNSPAVIESRIAQLKSLPMRLEMKEGLNGCTILDDSYSNDLAGLKIALDFLRSQRTGKSLVILSDMQESGLAETVWVDQIDQLLMQYKVDKLIAIGPVFGLHANRMQVSNITFSSVEELLHEINLMDIAHSTVLIKGARTYHLERIVQRLQKKIHGTVMEISLGAIVHNLNLFRSRLMPGTKIMAMVKAFAYGSGSHEVASILQYHKVDYLGVAYTDEGKILRSHGIHLPIMVMNPTPDSFQALIDLSLQPSVFSLSLLKSLIAQIHGSEIGIHLKMDTGMHRLGFEEEDLDELIDLLNAHPHIKIKSMYSHLAGSDDSNHDAFSAQQAEKFNLMCNKLASNIHGPFLKHILNSAGISRLGQFQLDMVRLGIGLYGIDSTDDVGNMLKPAVVLKATISQIKKIKPGETIGYGRQGKSESEMTLATISIGYADGYNRAFSKGVGKVLIHSKRAPVVGRVCMDMTMIDISGIDAQEGDEVIIFGDGLPVTEVASWINTIPYEILTSTSDRVKRVFFAESI